MQHSVQVQLTSNILIHTLKHIVQLQPIEERYKSIIQEYSFIMDSWYNTLHSTVHMLYTKLQMQRNVHVQLTSNILIHALKHTVQLYTVNRREVQCTGTM